MRDTFFNMDSHSAWFGKNTLKNKSINRQNRVVFLKRTGYMLKVVMLLILDIYFKYIGVLP